MANNCSYAMKAVSKTKEALERLIKIMKYEDNEYFIYRCFEASEMDDIIEKDGFFHVYIIGDVAWSCKRWFETKEDKSDLIVLKYNKVMNPIYGTSHYVSLDILCKKLDIAIELYSTEIGIGFQEYYKVNNHGEIVFAECVDYTEQWFDENGDDLDEPICSGGIEGYGCFLPDKEIYA